MARNEESEICEAADFVKRADITVLAHVFHLTDDNHLASSVTYDGAIQITVMDDLAIRDFRSAHGP